MATVEVLPAGMKPAVPVESPSEQIVKAANKTASGTDSRGRVIVVRRVSALTKMRLLAIAGPELAKNEQWIGFAALASSVQSIDGDAMTANTIREIEFIVDRLDDEGLETVGRVYAEAYGISVKDDAIGIAKN